MRTNRGTFKRAALLAGTAACLLGAPATASAGGIDSTKACIEEAHRGWNPASVRSTMTLADRLRLCNAALVAHLMDTRKRDAWQRCVMYGISHSVPPLGWEPAVYGLVSCSQTWMDFHPRVDPPSVTG